MYLVMLTLLFLLAFFSGLSILWINWSLNFKFYFSRENSAPFECGFDPKDSSRLPFSIRFFCLLILFLIFDVELVLLLQIPLSKKMLMKKFFCCTIFFGFLILGLLEEWRRGMLKWEV